MRTFPATILLWILTGLAAAAQFPRIANGVLTSEWPAVVALVAPGAGISFCTGTLIGCRTVVTAAHCLCGEKETGANCRPNTAKVAVAYQYGPEVAVNAVSVPPNYVFGEAADIALLTLAEPLTGVRPRPVNTVRKPAPGSGATVVGYGITREGDRDGAVAAADSGVKRRGQVSLTACDPSVDDDEHLCWESTVSGAAPGVESNTCQGDSGGPLFVDFGAGPVVAGITSGGLDSCQNDDSRSFDADVFRNRQWLLDQAGADLNTGACGTLPPVGQAGNSVVASQGIFGNGRFERLLAISVPPGTQRMRAVLNGVEGFDNDYDLFLGAGTEINKDAVECEALNNVNFAYCEVVAPQPGDWRALASLPVGDGGAYQLTVTLFGAGGVITEIFRAGFESG